MDQHRQIIIADGQFLVVQSLKQFISNEFGWNVEEISNDTSEFDQSLRKGTNTLVIFDPDFFDQSVIQNLETANVHKEASRVLILTGSLTKNEFQQYQTAGIRNIALKTVTREELKSALSAAMEGNIHYSQEILELLTMAEHIKKSDSNASLLTKTETEIVKLIAEGFKTREIAAMKFISQHTVITHRKNIFRKLSVGSISELVMFAIKNGIIDNIEYHI